MSNQDEQTKVRIELTDEQRQQLRDATGQEANALEFSAEELEERIAPMVQ